jgi:hypothetical protein
MVHAGAITSRGVAPALFALRRWSLGQGRWRFQGVPVFQAPIGAKPNETPKAETREAGNLTVST